MSKNKVFHLVKEHAKKGRSLEEVKRSMKLFGWSDSFIQEMFKSYDIPLYFYQQRQRYEFFENNRKIIIGSSYAAVLTVLLLAMFFIPSQIGGTSPTGFMVFGDQENTTINETSAPALHSFEVPENQVDYPVN